ncbi:MAG: methyltransferase domain-containing protein [Planctomycetes bacterium]|nr:methyltransferase domain-containing protein [Planctomycetota bacterium]
MKESLLEYLICPDDGAELEFTSAQKDSLQCKKCARVVPIREGIPDFTEQGNYTGNFGFQWNKFDKTQLDSYSGLSISKDRFFQVTGWSPDAPEEVALEVGCGAGRFTEVAATTGRTLISVDASEAVFANGRNNGDKENVHIVRADLRHLPFRQHSFHKVFCLGVLQHTPDPKASFDFIAKMPKKNGGEFAFDVYGRTWNTIFWSKYWLRPVTKNIPDEKLFAFLEKAVKPLLLVHDIIRLIPGIGRSLAYHLVPVCTYKYSWPLNKQQNYEWALLDTFDMLSPTYDIPCSMEEVVSWCENHSPASHKADYGPNGIIGLMKY